MRVLVIDNYDSFTYNLVQYLGELGAKLEIVRNDVRSAPQLLRRKVERVVISPGPGSPDQAGVSVEALKGFGELNIPVLGVCLGHQSLAKAFGGEVIRGEPTHGKSALIEHDGKTIFHSVTNPMKVGRYHSLVVSGLPPELEVSAWTANQTVMAMRHRELPIEGVQFHPESILTPDGKQLLKNFLNYSK